MTLLLQALAFIVDAYDTDEFEGRKRTVLRLHPRLAPVKAAVLIFPAPRSLAHCM